MKEPKFSIWKDGERILKLSRKQATDIQEGVLDIRQLLKGVDDVEAFLDEIQVATNKFEAHANFAKEQALYELKLADMKNQNKALDRKLAELNVNMDKLSSIYSVSHSIISRANSRQVQPLSMMP